MPFAANCFYTKPVYQKWFLHQKPFTPIILDNKILLIHHKTLVHQWVLPPKRFTPETSPQKRALSWLEHDYNITETWRTWLRNTARTWPEHDWNMTEIVLGHDYTTWPGHDRSLFTTRPGNDDDMIGTWPGHAETWFGGWSIYIYIYVCVCFCMYYILFIYIYIYHKIYIIYY